MTDRDRPATTTSTDTRWSMIHAAARGDPTARAQFALRYAGPLRAYYIDRWCGTARRDDVEDATQEVFARLFGAENFLARLRGASFRAYLYGVARNVAREFEAARRRHPRATDGDAFASLASSDESVSVVFDHAWALDVVRQARELMSERARAAGTDAVERVELLRLRFEEGKPIRAIAAATNGDPARLHHEYARARREFRAALADVVGQYVTGPRRAIERECQDLLALLA